MLVKGDISISAEFKALLPRPEPDEPLDPIIPDNPDDPDDPYDIPDEPVNPDPDDPPEPVQPDSPPVPPSFVDCECTYRIYHLGDLNSVYTVNGTRRIETAEPGGTLTLTKDTCATIYSPT